MTSPAPNDNVPRPPQAMAAWFTTKRANGYPVVGAVDASAKLLAFASWGTFRAFPAYNYTVEHSVYVHHEQRGRRLGKLLMKELIRRARPGRGRASAGGIAQRAQRLLRRAALQGPMTALRRGPGSTTRAPRRNEAVIQKARWATEATAQPGDSAGRGRRSARREATCRSLRLSREDRRPGAACRGGSVRDAIAPRGSAETRARKPR